jgi:hypothetical protein
MNFSTNITLQTNGNLTLVAATPQTVTWVGGTSSSGITPLDFVKVSEKGISNLLFAIKNNHASASMTMTSIAISGQIHPDEDWEVLATGVDYSSNRIVKDAILFSAAGVAGGTNFTTIAHGETAWILLAVPTVYNVKVTLTSSTGGTVKAYALGYHEDIVLPGEEGDITTILATLATAAKQDTQIASLGAITDAPVAYDGAEESGTARSLISLGKRTVNALKAACASLVSVVANQLALKKAVGFKMTLASGALVTCTAAATNYTATGLTAGGIYELTNSTTTSTTAVIFAGEADTTVDANKVKVITCGQCHRYEIQGTTLHVSSTFAGATLRIAKLDVA